MALLGAVVVRVDLRPDLDLLDDRLRLVLARFPGLQRRLVLELAEVHELADRRPCRRRDFDEVEIGLLSQPQRVGDRYDPDLLARRAYETNFRYPDTVVDSRFSADVTSNVTSFLTGTIPGQAGRVLAVNAESPARLACGATTDTATATQADACAASPRNVPALGRVERQLGPPACASQPIKLPDYYPPAGRRQRRRGADKVGGGRGGPPLTARRAAPNLKFSQ